MRRACLSRSFDGDDFDDVEEDEGLEDLENAEEVGAPARAVAGEASGALPSALARRRARLRVLFAPGGTGERGDPALGRAAAGEPEADHHPLHDQVRASQSPGHSCPADCVSIAQHRLPLHWKRLSFSLQKSQIS